MGPLLEDDLGTLSQGMAALGVPRDPYQSHPALRFSVKTDLRL